MKERIILPGHLMLVLAFLFFAAGCHGDSDAPRTWHHEELMRGAGLVEPDGANGIRIVYLAGKPYQMGYQQGVLLSEELGALLATFEEELIWKLFYELVKVLSPDGSRSYLEYVRENSYDFVIEECEGMAAGSGGVMDADLCIMHSSGMSIMDDLLPRYLPWISDIMECSGFIAADGATRDGRIIHARNLDYLAIDFIMSSPIVYVRQPENGLRHVNLGWPGMVGVVTGMNEKGLAGQLNDSSCASSRFRDLSGVPPEQQLLLMLSSAETIADAEAILDTTDQAACQVLMLSHGPSRSGAVYEMWAHGYGARYLEDSASGDVVFATNHFIHPDARKAQSHIDERDLNENSVSRHWRLSERLTGESLPPHAGLAPGAPDYSYGRIDVETAIDIMRDPVDLRPDQGRKMFPCTEHLDGNWALGNNHAVQSVVMMAGALRFWMAAGWDEECTNAIYNPFVGFDLADLLSGQYMPGRVPTYDPPYNGAYGSGFHGG